MRVLLLSFIGHTNSPRSAQIYIGKRAPIDTSNHEPDKDLLTWMRVLTVSARCVNTVQEILANRYLV